MRRSNDPQEDKDLRCYTVAIGIVERHCVLHNEDNRSAGQSEAHNMPAFNLTHYGPLQQNPT
jgi:hypothetical protein